MTFQRFESQRGQPPPHSPRLAGTPGRWKAPLSQRGDCGGPRSRPGRASPSIRPCGGPSGETRGPGAKGVRGRRSPRRRRDGTVAARRGGGEGPRPRGRPAPPRPQRSFGRRPAEAPRQRAEGGKWMKGTPRPHPLPAPSGSPSVHHRAPERRVRRNAAGKVQLNCRKRGNRMFITQGAGPSLCRESFKSTYVAKLHPRAGDQGVGDGRDNPVTSGV